MGRGIAICYIFFFRIDFFFLFHYWWSATEQEQAYSSCSKARLMVERMGKPFQKLTVAAARLAMPSGVNSNFYRVEKEKC